MISLTKDVEVSKGQLSVSKVIVIVLWFVYS